MEEKVKPDFHMVSFSGGKDSTAMLLRMVDEGWPIDMILFCDTGLEFPIMYDHIKKIEKVVGKEITVLKSAKSFDYWMTEHKHIKGAKTKVKEDQVEVIGYGWPTVKVRWCTDLLKDKPREKLMRELNKDYNVIEYLGIAADETKRLEKSIHKGDNRRLPLVEWGMTEADCLNYCKERGYTWGGLYDHFSRVSCWCCPLKPLGELREIYFNFPELWAQLEEWESKCWNRFQSRWSVWELAYRFEFEKEWEASGQKLRTRKFFGALREGLAKEAEKRGIEAEY